MIVFDISTLRGQRIAESTIYVICLVNLVLKLIDRKLDTRKQVNTKEFQISTRTRQRPDIIC